MKGIHWKVEYCCILHPLMQGGQLVWPNKKMYSVQKPGIFFSHLEFIKIMQMVAGYSIFSLYFFLYEIVFLIPDCKGDYSFCVYFCPINKGLSIKGRLCFLWEDILLLKKSH